MLAPREERRIEESVRLVGPAGRGPLVVGVLVVGAFLLGLVRPWDLLVPSPTDGGGRSAALAGSPPPGAGAVSGAVASGGSTTAGETAPREPTRALTCAYPTQWRSATIEEWNGKQARVWRAATVVPASGPGDPAIQFEPIVALTTTAIGWCAPVDEPDRPPMTLEAFLYRMDGGVAVRVPYDRLEPSAPDALGELWIPKPQGVGNRPTWPQGRYVIELRSPSGGYVRYLGLELSDRFVRPTPVPAASASAEPSVPASP